MCALSLLIHVFCTAQPSSSSKRHGYYPTVVPLAPTCHSCAVTCVKRGKAHVSPSFSKTSVSSKHFRCLRALGGWGLFCHLALFFFFFYQSMTSLRLKIEQGIFSIRNVVRTKGKIPMLAKLLSGANEGRSLTSLHAGNQGNHSLNTSSPFRRCCLCPTLVPDMLGVGYHLLSGEDTIAFRGPTGLELLSRLVDLSHSATWLFKQCVLFEGMQRVSPWL